MIEKSITDRVVGNAITQCQQSPNAFVRHVCSRMLAITLPVFHVVDAIHYGILYATATRFGTRSFSQIDPEQQNKANRYSELAKAHLRNSFSAVPKVMTNQPNPFPIIEQKIDLPKQGITYQMMPLSRLGDNLNCYFNAKWIAYKTGLPLIFKSFDHADELRLAGKQAHTIPSELRCYSFGTPFSYEEFEKNKGKEVVWEVPFFAMFNAKIDWNDPNFRASVLDDLKPVDPQMLPPLVPDRKNIALHVRTGGNFDSAVEPYYNPAKIPPREYFEQALGIALEEWKDEPLHIQIFTDSTDPEKEVERFTAFCKQHHKDVTIRCDTKKGASEDLVTQDMVAMTRYDALIRADSGLSKMSSLIGKPALEIAPPSANSYRLEGGKIHFDSIQVTKREKDRDGQVVQEQAEYPAFHFEFQYHINPASLAYFYKHHASVIGEDNIKK